MKSLFCWTSPSSKIRPRPSVRWSPRGLPRPARRLRLEDSRATRWAKAWPSVKTTSPTRSQNSPAVNYCFEFWTTRGILLAAQNLNVIDSQTRNPKLEMSAEIQSQPAYRRVLLKISGEALMGEQTFGIDVDIARSVAEEVKQVHDLGIQ